MIVMAALVCVLLFVVVALSYRLWKLRQVGGTAAILRVAGAPLSFFMRRTAGSGPALLRLKSRRD